MDALLFALLGIRTALKAVMSTTAAEMVYGTTLCLPGEFFSTSSLTTTLVDPSDYVNQLKSHIRQLLLVPPRITQSKSSTPEVLKTATHVFIRHDIVCKPLQPPYDGRTWLLNADKYFIMSLNGRKDTVSINRLKPAHIKDLSDADVVAQAKPATSTQSQTQTVTTQQNPTTPAHSQTPTTTVTMHTRTTRFGQHVHWPRRFTQVV